MALKHDVFRLGFWALDRSGLGRCFTPFTQGAGVIFMLHRVLPESDRPFQPNKILEISPEFLKKAVRRIRANGYEIVSLGQAVDLLRSGYSLKDGTARYAVLTFDDGFRDNYDIAYPILKQEGAPFTIFFTSGLLDRTTELWWVALERLIEQHDHLDLTGCPRPPATHVACAQVEEKYAAFHTLKAWLTEVLCEREQRVAIRFLAQRYGLDLKALADELIMTWDEVRELSREPLATLGAHTSTHPALARLERDEAKNDIAAGLTRMEQETGRLPKHFAYPYGDPRVACEREFDIASELGFRSAVTTRPGVLKTRHAKAPTALPRVSLNGQFQDEFFVDQYLSGAPFTLYNLAKWGSTGFGIRSGISRLFPSTK